MIGRALALRAVADAKLLQNEKLGRAAEERLRELVGDIELEARQLCADRTTYYLAAEVPEILAQYAYLRRGLRIVGELQPTSVSVESRPLPWADYLEHAAGVLGGATDEKEKGVGSREQIQLKTLRDFEWYLELLGEPRNSDLDLHSKDAVSLKELFEVVGAPSSTRLPAASIQSLKALALPEFRRNLSAAIASEFGWAEAPTLSAKIPERTQKPVKMIAAQPAQPAAERSRCPRCERQYPSWKRYCEHCSVAL